MMLIYIKKKNLVVDSPKTGDMYGRG